MKTVTMSDYNIIFEDETFDKNVDTYYDYKLDADVQIHVKSWDKIAIVFDDGTSVVAENFSVIYNEIEEEGFLGLPLKGFGVLEADRSSSPQIEYNCQEGMDVNITFPSDNEEETFLQRFGLSYNWDKDYSNKTVSAYSIVFDLLQEKDVL